jgi:hypothetical protein
VKLSPRQSVGANENIKDKSHPVTICLLGFVFLCRPVSIATGSSSFRKLRQVHTAITEILRRKMRLSWRGLAHAPGVAPSGSYTFGILEFARRAAMEKLRMACVFLRSIAFLFALLFASVIFPLSTLEAQELHEA